MGPQLAHMFALPRVAQRPIADRNQDHQEPRQKVLPHRQSNVLPMRPRGESITARSAVSCGLRSTSAPPHSASVRSPIPPHISAAGPGHGGRCEAYCSTPASMFHSLSIYACLKDKARSRSHQRLVPPSFQGVAKRASDLSQIKLNDECLHALDLIERQGQSVFLTGKAGTGKSTFLHYLREKTAKATVVLAPTGVAALNVGGQTIHSFFQFPPTIIDPQSVRRRRNPKLFQKLQTLIIDEVSMVRADVMDAVDRALRVQRDNMSTPFGGVQVVLCGDLFQLPPIVRDGEMRAFFDEQYGGPYFFLAHVFDELRPSFLELTTIYRQRDETFIRVLNKILSGCVSYTH